MARGSVDSIGIGPRRRGRGMNSMHKLSDTRVRPDAQAHQARQRKIDAWLQVAASLGEQIAVELQTATDQLQLKGMADLQRATALAQRLAKNSRAMHDTLGTLFDRGEKSEEHGMKRTEDDTMDEQVNPLAKDMAGVKLDVADLKVDVAGIKVDVADLKVDVAGLKTDVTVLKTDVGVLKTDVSGLKLDLAVVRSNYATKSDVAEAKSAVILSCVGTMIALSGVAFAVARLVH
jgi:archaellum component FlaC